MQEEVERKTVALVFKAAKFTGDELSSAMREFLNRGMNKLGDKKVKTGEMKIGDLVSKGSSVKNIEVNAESIGLFKKVAGKYKVDYAVRKDTASEIPKYLVFFQGKDLDVIKACFNEYVSLNEKQKEKQSVRKQIKENKEKLKERKQNTKNKEKVRNKNKDKSL